MGFIHFGLRMQIEELYLKWCEEEGVANKPNSFVAFMMSKKWLNEEKIIEDLDGKTEPQRDCDNCKHKGYEGCEQPCLGCGWCDDYEPKDEPQTASELLVCGGNCWMKREFGDWLCDDCQRELQTERSE